MADEVLRIEFDEGLNTYALRPALRLQPPPDRVVRRVSHDGACDDCIGRAHDYPYADASAYVTHPSCRCTWEVGPQRKRAMAMKRTFATGKGGYLVTDSDGTQHLPTTDDGKVSHTLMGAAWAALHGGYRGNEYEGPNKAKAIAKLKALYAREGMKTPSVAASRPTFAAEMIDEASTEQDVVVRTGLLFRTGDYPDQHFSMTPDELRATAAAFKGGYVEIEHLDTFGMQTILTGKTGDVREVWTSDDGTELYGDVALPAWLDAVAAGEGHKVSSVFDPQTKAFMGVGLCLDPIVSDAALFSKFAAFARHDTPHGQRALQHVHDVAASYGAVCSASNAAMASRHESSGMQTIHDSAVSHGATCAAVARGRSGVSTGGGMYYSKPKGARLMNLLGLWKKTTAEERAALKELGAEVPDEAVFAAAREIADAEMAEERKRMGEQLRAETAKRLQGEAATFAKEQILASKAYPAEKESIIAQYLQASMDDATHGAAAFSGSATATSRVELLRANFTARPAHGLTRENLDPTQQIRIVPAAFAGQETEGEAGTPTPDGQEISTARRDYLLRLANAAKREA